LLQQLFSLLRHDERIPHPAPWVAAPNKADFNAPLIALATRSGSAGA
jgi:hypothetical protein